MIQNFTHIVQTIAAILLQYYNNIIAIFQKYFSNIAILQQY